MALQTENYPKNCINTARERHSQNSIAALILLPQNNIAALILLPFDPPASILFSMRTSFHNRQIGLQDLVQASQEQGYCPPHLLRTICCLQYHLETQKGLNK